MNHDQKTEDQNWVLISELIRDHIEELAQSSRERYRSVYKYSSNSNLPEEAALRWCRECFLILANELESGSPDSHLYETLGGDMVVQRESMLYQIDTYMEETLFVSRLVAELICKSFAGSVSLINSLLTSLESFVQWRLTENLTSFTETISQPQVLAWAWRLDAQRNGAIKDGGNALAQDTSQVDLYEKRSNEISHSTLTAREYDIARLVSEGKTNAQIASLCSIKLSTVKNTLSRVYAKLQVANRVELAIALKSISEPWD